MVAGLAAATALLLVPPVAERLFAMSFLMPAERRALWLVAGLLLVVAVWLAGGRSRRRPDVAALLFAALTFVGLELAARAYVVLFRPDARLDLARLANRTYPELFAYRGHPFLQFTGAPRTALVGNRALGDLVPFNNLGFPGPDVDPNKPPGTVRVAALGGSTTASGYPRMLEEILAERDDEARYEVLNFGLGWYSTAHSLVNFVLNVVDLDPDVVILHHAWNDQLARGAPDGAFRGDYSHALRPFREPRIPDRWPIRASILYRYLKHRLTPTPAWAYLDAATVRLERPRAAVGERYADPKELAPYRRNLVTLVELAGLRGIRAVLTTQPYSRDPTIAKSEYAPHIAQCNDIVRELAAAHPGALFVDLDSELVAALGPSADVFLDVAHVDERGRHFKAERLAAALLGERLEVVAEQTARQEPLGQGLTGDAMARRVPVRVGVEGQGPDGGAAKRRKQ